MDHTISCDAIFDRDAREAVDFDSDEATISSNINA
jgi:hypothetical protein